MSCSIQTISQWVENIFPKRLAEDWDNVGFQVGNPKNRVNNVLLALDLTESVLQEAIAKECGLIITHHPLIFKGLKSINSDTMHGNLIEKLFVNNISLYSAHTNMDIAENGINDYIADKLGLAEVTPLSVTGAYKLYKMAVYVPLDYCSAIMEAAAAAGAGHLGNYSNCSFSTEGKGTCKPLNGSNAFIGVKNKLETVIENKIEFLVRENDLKRVLACVKKVHPYEEMAYDIFEMQTGEQVYGIGRFGKFPESIALSKLVIQCKEIFNTGTLRVVSANNVSNAGITRVALCSGSGGPLLRDALRKGADIFITGEVKYHEALDSYHQGLSIIEAGHFETETIFMEYLMMKLNNVAKTAKQQVQFIVSDNQKSIFTFV